MAWIWEKLSELTSNLWVKSVALFPMSLIVVEQREQVIIVAFAIIIAIDCIFGVMVSVYCDNNFKWSLLGKKFSKKFLLYFFTMLASFILHNAYSFMEWWFYTISTIIVFSEFGSLLHKAKRLGLPVDTAIITALNKKIDTGVRTFLGINCQVERSFKRRKGDK